ncbi:unnamed protein product [Musa acuminata subsp. burmannicoides]
MLPFTFQNPNARHHLPRTILVNSHLPQHLLTNLRRTFSGWIQLSSACHFTASTWMRSSRTGAATITGGFLDLIDDNNIPARPQQGGKQFFPDTSASSAGADTSSTLEPRQSLPVQAMEMSNASDPDRIPSSVFTRTKSTTQKDWSVASNESLFSIHVGNSSLSRDHVLGPVEHLPMSTDSGLNRGGIDAEQVSLELTAAAAANAEAMKDVLPEHAEEHAKKEQHSAEEGSTLPTNSLYRSDESFAFPMYDHCSCT